MNSIIKVTFIMIFVLFVLGSTFVHAGYGRHSYGGFCQGDFIVLMGFLALIGLIITLILAYKKSGSRKTTIRWHKNIAIITIGIAILHGVSALFFH